MTLITRHIPHTDHYPGLIAHKLSETREIVVMGDDERAEEILRKAVEEKGR